MNTNSVLFPIGESKNEIVAIKLLKRGLQYSGVNLNYTPYVFAERRNFRFLFKFRPNWARFDCKPIKHKRYKLQHTKDKALIAAYA